MEAWIIFIAFAFCIHSIVNINTNGANALQLLLWKVWPILLSFALFFLWMKEMGFVIPA